MKKTKIAGATFNGKVTFNGPMFHIHDNGPITIVNGKDMVVEGNDNGNDDSLPKELDTARARKYFHKAIERGYMREENGRFRWIGTDDRGNRSELAYFLGKVFGYVHTSTGNAGENFPEESLGKLFGVTRLYSLLTQVYNAQKPQRWRAMIDELFE
ncbi:MAG: hypothetical protein IKZ61_01830 [Prevotella sp.]|nr:hypothetical protein [Prevotella sp.]